MSRHRFVRNLDIDDVMADEDEDVIDDGMTAEERAQMTTSFPIAKSYLKDLKPPIPDDAIADSLWHYWFDVEKAVQWLRRDWEKKGSSIPNHLQPTPDESPRPRKAKRPRLDDLSSPQPPLTALQRLSISRKQSQNSQSDPPAQSNSLPSTPEPGKPMSKLALLAQKRREAALASNTPSTSPLIAPLGSISPKAGEGEGKEPESSKPISKLAQKMAAAKLAREAANSPSTTTVNGSSASVSASASGADEEDEEEEIVFTPRNPLFDSSPTRAKSPQSQFFDILTSTAHHPQPPANGIVTNMHLPIVNDVDRLEDKIKKAFQNIDSPDDIVLKARGGRAGTSTLTAEIKRPER